MNIAFQKVIFTKIKSNFELTTFKTDSISSVFDNLFVILLQMSLCDYQNVTNMATKWD